jgi:Na+/melibiose symporter-like transporter
MHVRKVFLIASVVPTLIFISGVIFLESTNETGENDFTLEEENKYLLINEEKNKEGLETKNNQLNVNEDKSIIVDDKKEEIHQANAEPANNVEKQGKVDKGQMVLDFFNFLGQKYVYIPTIFLIVFMATPSYSDPFFYFLTNVLKFKATQLGKIAFGSTLATLLSIIFYRYYLKNTNFKTIIIICSLLAFLFNFLAWVVVTRYNVVLGINDFWLCLVSNSLLAGLGELILMPMLALACQLCPKNLEGTVYSFFMSALNFGGIMSGLNGSFLTSALGITSKNFHNLPELILISNVISLLPLFLLCCIDISYFHPEMNKSSSEASKEKEGKLNISSGSIGKENLEKKGQNDNSGEKVKETHKETTKDTTKKEKQ